METTSHSIELGYREGSSDKVYRASVEPSGIGFVVNFAYGRRGSSLAAGTKTQEPVTLDEAMAIYERLVRSKMAKGYKPTGAGLNGIGVSVVEPRQDTGMRAQLLNPITENEAERYLADPDWCAQEKFDGKRILVRKTDSSIVAANRHGQATGVPDTLRDSLMRIEGDFEVDGELVGETFHAFDILENMEGDWRQAPYRERLHTLVYQFGGLGGNILVAETEFGTEKRGLLAQLRASGKEGIVFKDLEASWMAGRPASGGSALKMKFWASCSCVVARINAKRSVEIALDGVDVGNVTIPPNMPVPVPGQVVEVRYLYVNGPGGALYQPVYLGVRDDVPADDCTVIKQRLKYKAVED